MIGRTLAHYTIESKLGEGGMGAVYKRATRAWIDRSRSRCCRRTRSLIPDAGSGSSRRPKRQAPTHPNIVTIHDISASGDGDFMVMEFIDGQTLEALIPRGGMRPARY